VLHLHPPVASGDYGDGTLLDTGVDITEVQALLGHMHVTVTQVHDKRRPTTRETASHKLPLGRPSCTGMPAMGLLEQKVAYARCFSAGGPFAGGSPRFHAT